MFPSFKPQDRPTSVNHRLIIVSLVVAPILLLAVATNSDTLLSKVGIHSKILLYLVMVIGWCGALRWWLVRGRSHISRLEALYLALFGWLLFCSIFIRIVEGESIAKTGVLDLISCFAWCSIYLSVTAWLRTRDDFRFLLAFVRKLGFAVTGSVYLGMALDRLFGIGFGEVVVMSAKESYRYFGPLGDNVGWIIILFALLAATRLRWLEMAFHVGGILLTGTRGSFFGLVVGIGWVILVTLKNKQERRLVRLMIVFVITVAILGSIWGYASTSIERLTTSGELTAGIDSRTLVFGYAVEVLVRNPFVGCGYGGFRFHWEEVGSWYEFPENSTYQRATYYTQNQVLQCATDGGLVALGLYVAWVVGLLIRTRRCVRSANSETWASLLAIEGFLIAMIIGNQSAVWFVDFSTSGFFIMIVAGIITQYNTLPMHRVTSL